MRTPEEVLKAYQEKCAELKEKGSTYKEIAIPTVQDVLYLKMVLHPTRRKESKELTHALITFICERGIVTAQEIYDGLGFAETPVLTRIKKLKEQGYIRREHGKYYIATPRLLALVKKDYLRRVCGD